MTRSTTLAVVSAVLLMSPPVYSLQHGRGSSVKPQPHQTSLAPHGAAAKPSTPKTQPSAPHGATQKTTTRPTTPKSGPTAKAQSGSSKNPSTTTARTTGKPTTTTAQKSTGKSTTKTAQKTTGKPDTKTAQKTTKKSETTTARKQSTTKDSTTATTTTTTTTGTDTTLTPVQQKLQKNTNLASKLQSRLPAGTDLMAAADGFRNLGQFVAAVNVSNNLNIPFADLKTKMVTEQLSLGQSIQTLRPVASATVEAQRAEYDARTLITQTEATPTSTTPTSTTPTSTKKGRKPSAAGGGHE